MTWTHPSLPLVLDTIPEDIESLLDLGTGRGTVGALCRIYRETRMVVGVDFHLPYLSFVKEYSLYDELLRIDLREGQLPFKERSFDVVTLIEVIEHLPKRAGHQLIRESERLAKRRVIISTPNVQFDQPNYDGNPLQTHQTVWSYAELKALGYKVYGVGSFIVHRSLWKAGALSRFTRPVRKPASHRDQFGSMRLLSRILGGLTYFFPAASSLFLGIKDIEPEATGFRATKRLEQPEQH